MAGKQNSVDEEEIMTDADFEKAMQALVEEEGNEEVNNLLMAMSDNQIISWDEAERILGETSNEPVKSSLPQQTRPTEPDNDTDVDVCMQKLQNNDPKLVEINLNNMKRTPVPKIKRMIEAMQDNEHLEKLSLANMGLYDMDLQPLIDVLERNTTLRCLNLETNYLSGEFFARLFKAALTNQSLEEVKAVNQGMAFSTQYEREIIESITQNRGLTKVSINLRLPEGRFKVEQATIRNQEIRRILRRQMLAEQKEKEEPKPKAPAKKETPRTESPEKKPPLKKQPSGAAAELAKQQSPSKLAIAGVNTPRPSTSNETAVRERARETEKASKKPYEAENAERLLLSEKAKQRNAGGRWPPAGEIDKPTTEETPKSQKTTMEEQSSKGEPQKGPNWRDRLAKKADQQEPPQQERKGSLALRDKFEQKGREVAKKPPPKEKEKLALGGTERLAAARGRFEKQKAAEGKSVEVDGGKEEAPRPKLKAKPKPVAAAAEAAAAENHEEKKADGPAGEKKPAPAVKKRVASSKKAAEEKDKDMEKPITTNEEEPSKPANAKPAGFTPSWRQRMNK